VRLSDARPPAAAYCSELFFVADAIAPTQTAAVPPISGVPINYTIFMNKYFRSKIFFD
jgi:hypothetical protein